MSDDKILLVEISNVDKELVARLRAIDPEHIRVEEYGFAMFAAGSADITTAAIWVSKKVLDVIASKIAAQVFDAIKDFVADRGPARGEKIRVNDRPFSQIDGNTMLCILKERAENPRHNKDSDQSS